MPEADLGRSRRVRASAEHRELAARGRRLHSPHFTLVYLARPEGGIRLGQAVGRKAGKAHDRNRIKRWVREDFRRARAEWEAEIAPSDPGPWGLDLVVIAKPGTKDLSHPATTAELAGLLARLADEVKRRNNR